MLKEETVQTLAAPGDAVPLELRINGETYHLELDPRVSLLDALRDYVGLSGTKKGCNQGACGACTVLVDGERINSCLTLALQQEGREITTIEGLGQGELHPLQAAFLEHDGFQCGYCTPGQICSAAAMLNEWKQGFPSAVSPDMKSIPSDFSEQEIKERMSGNLCRCGAYVGIVAAIEQVFAEQSAGK